MRWRWSMEVDIPRPTSNLRLHLEMEVNIPLSTSNLRLQLEQTFVGCPLSFVRESLVSLGRRLTRQNDMGTDPGGLSTNLQICIASRG